VSIADAGDLEGPFAKDYPWTLAACAKAFTIQVSHAGSPPYPIRIGGIGYVLTHNETVLDQVAASSFGLSPAAQVLLNLDGNRTLLGNWNLHIDTGTQAHQQTIGCYCHYEVEVAITY
jgi:hypothetical protein